MKYLEYMEEHPQENLGWCKPYVSKDGEIALIVHDGIAETAKVNGAIFNRYDGSLSDGVMEFIARYVTEESYDLYSGYSDQAIAEMNMEEVGCWGCPFKGDCDAMDEEIEGDEEA